MSRSANVFALDAGLKSYLFSGKSSDMSVSLRPISFHCLSRASDGLVAAFGAAAFFAESCAREGATTTYAATTAAHKRTLFMRKVPPHLFCLRHLHRGMLRESGYKKDGLS